MNAKIKYIICILMKSPRNIFMFLFGIEDLVSGYEGILETIAHISVTTLELIGKKRGCLIRGGEIDYDKVINIIMNEIKSGIIRNITFDRFED